MVISKADCIVWNIQDKIRFWRPISWLKGHSTNGFYPSHKPEAWERIVPEWKNSNSKTYQGLNSSCVHQFPSGFQQNIVLHLLNENNVAGPCGWYMIVIPTLGRLKQEECKCTYK